MSNLLVKKEITTRETIYKQNRIFHTISSAIKYVNTPNNKNFGNKRFYHKKKNVTETSKKKVEDMIKLKKVKFSLLVINMKNKDINKYLGIFPIYRDRNLTLQGNNIFNNFIMIFR